MDGVQDRARVEIVHEHRRPAQQRWNENAERLAEQMAERQHVQNANGLERARQALVFLHLTLDGREVGADILVAMHDADRIAGGAGCVDDFDDVSGGDCRSREIQQRQAVRRSRRK